VEDNLICALSCMEPRIFIFHAFSSVVGHEGSSPRRSRAVAYLCKVAPRQSL